jgi:hypothetical protein
MDPLVLGSHQKVSKNLMEYLKHTSLETEIKFLENIRTTKVLPTLKKPLLRVK